MGNNVLFLGISFLLIWAYFIVSSVSGRREGYKEAFCLQWLVPQLHFGMSQSHLSHTQKVFTITSVSTCVAVALLLSTLE